MYAQLYSYLGYTDWVANDLETARENLACEAFAGHDPSDRITLVGLVIESANGLRRQLAPAMDAELGVGGQAFEILIRLERSPEAAMRMSDLAAQTGLTPSGLTRALDRLVEVGFCSRQNCPSDRRGTFAQLTETGRQRVHEAIARHRADIDELLEGLLNAEEEAQLVALLHRLRDRVHPEAALLGTSEASFTL